MCLAVITKGESSKPAGSKTHIISTLPPAHQTRHFLTLAALEWGEMRPGPAQQTSRARVVKGGNQPPPNLPKRSQRISTQVKKRHRQVKHSGGGSHNRHQTLPNSKSNPTWLNSGIQANGDQNVKPADWNKSLQANPRLLYARVHIPCMMCMGHNMNKSSCFQKFGRCPKCASTHTGQAKP